MRLDVRHLASVGSTMDLAADAVARGEPEGIVFVADEQTAGRGRRGRRWSSPPGAGLYLSFLLRPAHTDHAMQAIPLITLATGVAVRQAVHHASGLACELKWPNDVMVGRRKLAGILAEGLGIGTPAQAVTLGIGVNILNAAHPGDVADRATSLEAELGRLVDRQVLLDALLAAIPETYARLMGGEAGDILRQWREAAPGAEGADVEWDAVAGARRGRTAGLDDTGALLVRCGHEIERVVAGELRWI